MNLPAEPCPDLDRELHRLACLLVGRMGLKQALSLLRSEMSSQALARTRGSRRAAAHMLGVDRRYVQRLAAQLNATKRAPADPTRARE